MTDTMISMELKKVETFKVSELMEGDLIGIDGSVSEVVSIDDTADGYIIEFNDEYGERDFIEVDEDEMFDIYVFVE